ncbi:MAG TPA: 3-deoxy-7-phosphoheptulonate synthase [Gammaproteobacteria bacterium]|jgi:3-deoxy-7-phosphoheptulonate synthase|nr:3-deoxy-7-phosphoheptulonate synthase [Gammaproteobacteria bacterium]
MNYTILKKLPLLEQIIANYPLSFRGQQKIKKDRSEIKNILAGKDPRLLIIVGPCSAWPKEAVLDYAEKLLALNEKVKHALKIVMRVYIQKPRTIKGWMGPTYQPNPFGAPNVLEGIQYARDMMIKIVEMGLPIADEALFTQNFKGFLELLSWVAIGARSAENPEHRIFASLIDCPVGMKNPTHGSLAISINSITSAQAKHITFFEGNEIETHGNPYAHLVLRGSYCEPNYSIPHLLEVKKYMNQHAIDNQAVIIDASHDNCLMDGKKAYHQQGDIIFKILKNLKNHSDLQKLVKGFMIESFIKEGNQSMHAENINLEGLSITDPCLGWEDTEKLLISLSQLQISLQ